MTLISISYTKRELVRGGLALGLVRLPGAFLTRGGAVDDLFAPRALAVFAGRGTEGALLRHNIRVFHRVQDPKNNSLRPSRAAAVGHELQYSIKLDQFVSSFGAARLDDQLY